MREGKWSEIATHCSDEMRSLSDSLARLSQSRLRSIGMNLSGGQSVEKYDRRLRSEILLIVEMSNHKVSPPVVANKCGKTYVEFIVDLYHRCVTARSQTFNFDDGELLVLRRLAQSDAEMIGDSLDDGIRSTSTEHARRSGANLDKVLSDWFSVS